MKVSEYRTIVEQVDDLPAYLRQESRLPGPRGNLELAQALADVGGEPLFLQLLAHGPDAAPTNTPGEFLAFCGTLGLGTLLAHGRRDLLPRLLEQASDSRWRVREAVAMALQRWGDVDMAALLEEMAGWALGEPLVQRAAAAGLCEPRLLNQPEHIRSVLAILDQITASVLARADRRNDEFKALRKALGYCWSVALAADPEIGAPYLERWLVSEDRDILWIMRSNLRKNRLSRAAPEWTARWRARLGIS